ncbi:MAG: hypothetical protein ABEL76_09050, partial [Bradymonadaceae bacterium]
MIRWPLPLAAVWVSFPVVGVLLSISFTPIAPYDYWWHLAMGRMTAATGTVPSSNLFLYTLPVDAPFLNQPWLGQLALYEVFRTWGHWGPYLLRNLIAGGTWIGLAAAAVDRSPDPRVAGGVLLAVGGLSGIVFGVRTRMFALPLYVATLAVTVAVADGRWSARWLWSLVPVTAVWSNLHGSFALAPALVAAIGGSRVVEEAIAGELEADLVRTWGGPGAAVALAGMANPHGWRAYEYVVELTFFSAIPSTVSEWQPPDPYQFFGAASLVLMVLALAIA